MTRKETLFELPELPMSEESTRGHGVPRLVRVCRDQYEMKNACLNDLISEDHPVRAVWDYVCTLDLAKVLNNIKSVEGGVGRPAIDPKVLVTLWLYATVDGVGSARLLAKLTEEHKAYQWICGGIDMDRKTISDFRTDAGDLFDDLLVQGVVTLAKAKIVKVKEVIQDGMRVRAGAAKGSFRRLDTLRELHKGVQDWIKVLRQEVEDDPRKCLDLKQAAKTAAANERAQRLENAMKQVEKFVEEKQANRKKHKKKVLTPEEIKEVRVSTTDPEARIMKMPNGGFSPAYNFQFGIDPESQIVLSATVTNSGRDAGQLLPMFDDIKSKYNTQPDRYIVDGGFVSKEDIKELAQRGCDIYAPVAKSRQSKHGSINIKRTPKREPAVEEWIDRMKKEESRKIYGRRMLVELVNAHMRNRGLNQLVVRGLAKAKIIASMFAVAYNMTRSFALGIS